MKYLKFVFENQEVCDLTDSNESLINIATNAVVYNSISLENEISSTLGTFLSSDSNLNDVYETIRDYAVAKSIDFYTVINEVLLDTSISDEVKAYILTPINETRWTDQALDRPREVWNAVKNAKFGNALDKPKEVLNAVKNAKLSDALDRPKEALGYIKNRLGATDDSIPFPLRVPGKTSMLDTAGSWISKNASDLVELAKENPKAAAAAAASALATGAGAAYGIKKFRNRNK
jgi:hypothetical protein